MASSIFGIREALAGVSKIVSAMLPPIFTTVLGLRLGNPVAAEPICPKLCKTSVIQGKALTIIR